MKQVLCKCTVTVDANVVYYENLSQQLKSKCLNLAIKPKPTRLNEVADRTQTLPNWSIPLNRTCPAGVCSGVLVTLVCGEGGGSSVILGGRNNRTVCGPSVEYQSECRVASLPWRPSPSNPFDRVTIKHH